MNIREQIEDAKKQHNHYLEEYWWYDGESVFDDALSTMEKLLAVAEATKRLMDYPDIRNYVGSVMAGYVDEALAELDLPTGESK